MLEDEVVAGKPDKHVAFIYCTAYLRMGRGW
jgi:hypothetical protein